MKVNTTLVIIIFFFSIFAQDNQPSDIIVGKHAIEGNFWRLLSSVGKIAFLQGYYEGYAAAKAGDELRLPENVGISHLSESIDKYYDDIKNVNVPIGIIIQLIRLSIEGISEDETEKSLIKVRKKYSK